LTASGAVSPSGEIVAACATLHDELAIARRDLELTKSYPDTVFNFARHREPRAWGLLLERRGAIPPPE